MLRRSISVKSPASSIRRLLNTMAAKAHDLLNQHCSGMCLCQSAGQCLKSSFIRTVVSCSINDGQGKVIEKSVERSRERGEIQRDKLSEDEKSIYLAHKSACMKGKNSYVDPITGYTVFTEEFLLKRRSCCGNACRHCPYGHENVPKSQQKKKFNSAFYV